MVIDVTPLSEFSVFKARVPGACQIWLAVKVADPGQEWLRLWGRTATFGPPSGGQQCRRPTVVVLTYDCNIQTTRHLPDCCRSGPHGCLFGFVKHLKACSLVSGLIEGGVEKHDEEDFRAGAG